VDVQGLNFLYTDIFSSFAFTFVKNFEIVHFDDINFRTRAGTSSTGTNIVFSDCSNGVFTDTTWQNLIFPYAFSVGYYNVSYGGTSCTTPITVNGDSTKAGYGASAAYDPNAALTWTP
jgi:hypothetical protein